MKQIEKQRPIAYYKNPKDMLIVEQVFVAIWLAQNHTLKDLRVRQDIIEQQMKACIKRSLPEYVYDNLNMMMELTCSAIAYKTAYDGTDYTWMGFLVYSR